MFPRSSWIKIDTTTAMLLGAGACGSSNQSLRDMASLLDLGSAGRTPLSMWRFRIVFDEVNR